MSKPENTLEAWWHLETLAPGQIKAKSLKECIAKKYLKKEEDNIEKFKILHDKLENEIPSIWKDLKLKSNKVHKKIGFYGYLYQEYELIKFQRELHHVQEEIINHSYTYCFSYYVEFDKDGRYIDNSLFIPHLQLYIKLMTTKGTLKGINFSQKHHENMILLNTQANAICGGKFSDVWIQKFQEQFEQLFGRVPRKEFNVLECILIENEDESIKFNSFFTEDLLSAQVDLNETLREFLTKSANRQDVNENRAYIENILHPTKLPLGRWPSPIQYQLSLMQQVAVNDFFETDALVSSVNGPPGTGKTTLLQDIFAEIIVRKADAMTYFRDDVNGMVTRTTLKEKIPSLFKQNQEEERFIHKIAPSITKHAMVVTSSNNGAVENISKELPQKGKIDKSFLNELMDYNYAPKTAEKLIDEGSWGLFSIALGNSSNIEKAAKHLLDRKFGMVNEWKNAGKLRKKAQENWEKVCDEFIRLKNEVEAEKYAVEQMINGRKSIDTKMQQSTDDFWKEGKEAYKKRQKSVLFQTDNLNTKRSKLFIKAIHVLNHFILIHGEKLRPALSLLEKKKTLDLNQKENIERLHIMWDTIHCFFPVVSTTFASFASMYRGIGKDFIPYLIIDEAGQAVPLQAVGALWRSRKTMIVGDPLQIEPVLTVDQTLLEDLRKIYNLEEDLLNLKSSVQSIADRSNNMGTFNHQKRWIGIPLWVHRRCLKPMFSIANELAYGGNMVLGKEGEGKSIWYDVKGEAHPRQFVKEQVAELEEKLKVHWTQKIQQLILNKMWSLAGKEPCEILKDTFHSYFMEEQETCTELNTLSIRALFAKYISYSPQLQIKDFEKELSLIQKGKDKFPSIFIITPFTEVKSGIKNHMGGKSSLWATLINPLNYELEHQGIDELAEIYRKTLKNVAKEANAWYEKWIEENIGTVHAFQGREAEIVFFITGTDEKQKPAAAWACKEPNMLNVAVTRAKEEFYIIGDLNLLSGYDNYQTILKQLSNYEKISNTDNVNC